jgi:hypothetical protein
MMISNEYTYELYKCTCGLLPVLAVKLPFVIPPRNFEGFQEAVLFLTVSQYSTNFE